MVSRFSASSPGGQQTDKNRHESYAEDGAQCVKTPEQETALAGPRVCTKGKLRGGEEGGVALLIAAFYKKFPTVSTQVDCRIKDRRERKGESAVLTVHNIAFDEGET